MSHGFLSGLLNPNRSGYTLPLFQHQPSKLTRRKSHLFRISSLFSRLGRKTLLVVSSDR